MPDAQPSQLTPIADAVQQLLATLNLVAETDAVPLRECGGRILAADFYSPMNVPPHNNSAMDGYAVRSSDLLGSPCQLEVSQRIVAGAVGEPLAAGEAARIFTGAPLPANADAVVMQENAAADANKVLIEKAVSSGENLRMAGEDVGEGQLLFAAGHRLRPQDVGVFASVGQTEVVVRRKLRIALLTTGDELVAPGTELKPGQIYNSNFFGLATLLDNLGAEVSEIGIVEDDFDHTKAALENAANSADVVISTGGVSVGEEDHVKAAVEACGHLDLWKLAIKPGKPFASGKIHATQFFGLPGNPVSAFVTFVLLVRPMLLTMLGCKQAFAHWLPMVAGFDAPASGERQEYLRVSLATSTSGDVQLNPFKNQSSGVGASLSLADGLAIIPPHTAVAQGDRLLYLPFSELIH